MKGLGFRFSLNPGMAQGWIRRRARERGGAKLNPNATVCVCVCARARACVCVCVCVCRRNGYAGEPESGGGQGGQADYSAYAARARSLPGTPTGAYILKGLGVGVS